MQLLEKDNYFDQRNNDQLDMFGSFHSYNIGFRSNEFPKITGLEEPLVQDNCIFYAICQGKENVI